MAGGWLGCVPQLAVYQVVCSILLLLVVLVVVVVVVVVVSHLFPPHNTLFRVLWFTGGTATAGKGSLPQHPRNGGHRCQEAINLVLDLNNYPQSSHGRPQGVC